MENFNKICIYIIINIFIFCIGFYAGENYNAKHISENIKLQDTTYNHIVLDSITYKIKVKDSIIYKLKTEMKDEAQKIYNLSDSATVKLFIELCESK